MPLFNGRFNVKGFEKISVDNFESHNYDCTAFFLSHCHRDHMRGMWNENFHALFSREGVMLYCHDITRRFLLKDEELLVPAERIRALDSRGTQIQVGETDWITVTWLTAGHCPGSVMFIFDGVGGRILYTGDFRLLMSDVQKLAPLHYGGVPMTVDHLYLDTTFASPDYLNFPRRERSLEIIKRYINDWFRKNRSNRVVILPTACIGFEYLMIKLHEAYGQKVHVAREAYDKFLCTLWQLEHVVTTGDEIDTRIHFCFKWGCDRHCFCYVYNKETVLLIKPSALYFTQEIMKQNGDHVFDAKAGILRVVYSSHSSCCELIEFVRYLNPGRVYPCVLPPGADPSPEGCKRFIDEFLGMCMRKRPEGDDEADDIDEYAGLSEMQILRRILFEILKEPMVLPEPDYELEKRLGLK